MNKSIAYLCIVSSLALLAAVNLRFLGEGSAARASGEKVRDLWRISIPVEMATLDPQQLLSVPEKSIGLLVFSRLVKMTEHLDIEADALESWSYDLTLNRYYFKIKEGVYFHDGRPLNADDVIFSMHQWARKESLDNDFLRPIRGVKEYIAGTAHEIKGISKLNPRTVAVDLEEWVEHFVKNLSNPRFCLYPAAFGGVTRAKFFEKPVGTGPFRLVSYTPSILKYEANPRYYAGKPVTSKIEVGHETFEQARTSFNAGRIDNLIMYEVPETQGFASEGVNIERFRSFSTYALIFNGGTPALRSPGVREAVASLVDKDRIIRNCYPGSAVATSLIPPGMVGSTGRAIGEAADARSRARLPALTLYIPMDLSAECLKNALIENFQGTPVRVAIVSFRKMYELLKAGTLGMWVESFEFKNDDPIGVLQYFSETSNEYLLGMKLPKLQALYRKLGGGLSSHDRAGLYREIDEYIVKDRLLVPIFHPSSYGIYRSSLRGIHNLRTWRYVANWHKVYAVE